ncbi:MAG: epoxyqueuosine reductase [Euryarchaeota archaeon]|nr:epoxyqueuosine reductase [Euryarchaeota archaeon]
MSSIANNNPIIGPNAEIRNIVEEAAAEAGIALVGYTDLKSLDNLLVGDPTTLEFQSAISLAVEIPEDAVKSAMSSPSISLREAYKQNNKCLKQASEAIISKLEEKGFRARIVDPAQRVDAEKLLGPISHKAIAFKAGIGWIGKSGLLVTEKFGPRVRMGTILTDVSMSGPSDLLSNQCGNCRECIDNCPTRSLKDMSFQDKPSSRDDVIDWAKCGRYEVALLGDGSEPEKACGRCIAHCPFSFSED